MCRDASRVRHYKARASSHCDDDAGDVARNSCDTLSALGYSGSGPVVQLIGLYSSGGHFPRATISHVRAPAEHRANDARTDLAQCTTCGM